MRRDETRRGGAGRDGARLSELPSSRGGEGRRRRVSAAGSLKGPARPGPAPERPSDPPGPRFIRAGRGVGARSFPRGGKLQR